MMVDHRSPTGCALNEKYGRENDRIFHWFCGIHQDFAGNTGCPERIITRETLEPGKIIAAFDSALETGYDNGIKQQMKESAVEYIGEYFKAAGI